MKNLILLLILLLQGSITFGQEKFENVKLALVSDIFHNTTRENIISYMESKNFEVDKTSTNKYLKSGVPVTEEIVFSTYLSDVNELEKIEILYGEKNQIIEVTYDYYGAINNDPIEKELKDKKYKSKLDEFKIFGSTVTHLIWSKSRKKNTFRTYFDNSNDVGELTYGVIEL